MTVCGLAQTEKKFGEVHECSKLQKLKIQKVERQEQLSDFLTCACFTAPPRLAEIQKLSLLLSLLLLLF